MRQLYSVLSTVYLYLNFFVSEGKEESLAMFGSQSVNAAGVDGPGQVVVHLLLGVLLVVHARPDAQLGLQSILVVLAVAHHPQLLADLAAQDDPAVPHDDVLLFGRVGEVVRGDDQVGLDVVLRQVLVSLRPVAVLDLVVSVEVDQSLRGDVDPTRDARALHDVGQGDIIGPNIELPLPQSQHSAVNSEIILLALIIHISHFTVQCSIHLKCYFALYIRSFITPSSLPLSSFHYSQIVLRFLSKFNLVVFEYEPTFQCECQLSY